MSRASRAVALLLLVTGGCAAPPKLTPTDTIEATPVFSPLPRLDAIPGRPLLITFNPADHVPEVTLPAAPPPRVRALHLRVRFEATSIDQPPAAWLGPPGSWEAAPPEPGLSPADLLVVEFAPGQNPDTLLLDGRERRINWLPSQSALPRVDPGLARSPWAPVAANPDLRRQLDDPRFHAAAGSPLERWRFLLLAQGLDPDAPPPPEFSDPVVEMLAQRQEAWWRVALARLWGADPELAARVKQRLALSVEFTPGEWAPAWDVSAGLTERLLTGLLEPDIGPADRRALAERWLADLPPAVAWIIDDGGTLGEQRDRILPSVGFASLWDRSTLCWTRWEDQAGEPDLRPLPPAAALALVVGPDPSSHASIGAGRLEAHVGEWSTSLPALTQPLLAAPPGLTLGPWLADWSLASWRAGRPRSPEPAWQTAALLHRLPDEPGASPALRSRKWELYVECKGSPGADLSAERVEIYTGPYGRPAAVMRVHGDGLVEFLPPPDAPAEYGEIASPPARTAIARSDGRWAFRVPLPPGSVEPDGMIRLGLTRLDARGRRTCAARPMLPWRQEPPRVAIDTSAWSGL